MDYTSQFTIFSKVALYGTTVTYEPSPLGLMAEGNWHFIFSFLMTRPIRLSSLFNLEKTAVKREQNNTFRGKENFILFLFSNLLFILSCSCVSTYISLLYQNMLVIFSCILVGYYFS